MCSAMSKPPYKPELYEYAPFTGQGRLTMAILPPFHALPLLAVAAVVLLGLWLLHCMVHSSSRRAANVVRIPHHG
jgi:hypothetical protein